MVNPNVSQDEISRALRNTNYVARLRSGDVVLLEKPLPGNRIAVRSVITTGSDYMVSRSDVSDVFLTRSGAKLEQYKQQYLLQREAQGKLYSERGQPSTPDEIKKALVGSYERPEILKYKSQQQKTQTTQTIKRGGRGFSPLLSKSKPKQQPIKKITDVPDIVLTGLSRASGILEGSVSGKESTKIEYRPTSGSYIITERKEDFTLIGKPKEYVTVTEIIPEVSFYEGENLLSTKPGKINIIESPGKDVFDKSLYAIETRQQELRQSGLFGEFSAGVTSVLGTGIALGKGLTSKPLETVVSFPGKIGSYFTTLPGRAVKNQAVEIVGELAGFEVAGRYAPKLIGRIASLPKEIKLKFQTPRPTEIVPISKVKFGYPEYDYRYTTGTIQPTKGQILELAKSRGIGVIEKVKAPSTKTMKIIAGDIPIGKILTGITGRPVIEKLPQSIKGKPVDYKFLELKQAKESVKQQRTFYALYPKLDAEFNLRRIPDIFGVRPTVKPKPLVIEKLPRAKSNIIYFKDIVKPKESRGDIIKTGQGLLQIVKTKQKAKTKTKTKKKYDGYSITTTVYEDIGKIDVLGKTKTYATDTKAISKQLKLNAPLIKLPDIFKVRPLAKEKAVTRQRYRQLQLQRQRQKQKYLELQTPRMATKQKYRQRYRLGLLTGLKQLTGTKQILRQQQLTRTRQKYRQLYRQDTGLVSRQTTKYDTRLRLMPATRITPRSREIPKTDLLRPIELKTPIEEKITVKTPKQIIIDDSFKSRRRRSGKKKYGKKSRKESIAELTPLGDLLSLTLTEAKVFGKGYHRRPTKALRQEYYTKIIRGGGQFFATATPRKRSRGINRKRRYNRIF